MEPNKMPDTPWHIGYAKKEDGDPRRHKSRCIYKEDSICRYGKSAAYLLKCPGSSHCKFYAENSKMAQTVYLKTRSAEEELRDNTKNKQPSRKTNIRAAKGINAITHNKKLLKVSMGKDIELSKIRVTQEYTQWKPGKNAIEDLTAYYKTHYKLDQAITVREVNGIYYLASGFLQYNVSKRLFLKQIKADIEVYGDRRSPETTQTNKKKKKG